VDVALFAAKKKKTKDYGNVGSHGDVQHPQKRVLSNEGEGYLSKRLSMVGGESEGLWR